MKCNHLRIEREADRERKREREIDGSAERRLEFGVWR